MMKGPDDDKLLELLRRGEVQPDDLDEGQSEVDGLGDELDELVVDAEGLRRQLGLHRKR